MSSMASTSRIAAAYDGSPALGARSQRAQRASRRIAHLLLYGAFGFAAAIAMSVTVPTLFGYKSLTVLSGSMAPTLRPGDIVVDSKIAPLDARVGDVVTFRDPERGSIVVTHRVVSMRASGDDVYFETKGDTNTGKEKWSMRTDGTLGRVEYRLPKIGYVMNMLGGRFGRLAFIVVPALLLVLSELRRIWRPEEEDSARGGRSSSSRSPRSSAAAPASPTPPSPR
jgi:signal peptidase